MNELCYLVYYPSLLADLKYNARQSLAAVRSTNAPKCKESLAQCNLLSLPTKPMSSDSQVRLQPLAAPHINSERNFAK